MAKPDCFQVFIVNLTIDGGNCVSALADIIALATSHIAEHPEKSVLIVFANHTGQRGNLYDEWEIQKASDLVGGLLAEPSYRFLTREGCIAFEPESVHGLSQRPAVHRFWMCVSDGLSAKQASDMSKPSQGGNGAKTYRSASIMASS